MSTPFAYLSCAALSDVGRRRKNNEDSLVTLPDNGVFCVADGMGGVQGGEVASKAVVDALQKAFKDSPEAPFSVTADASAKLFERAVNAASHWIKERAEGLGISGTGSTAVGLVFDRVTPCQGIALHAGDSRAYRFRDDKLVQLTTDHSVAAAAGLPDDSTLPAMFRGVITRAVGLDRNVALEATPFDVKDGDVFLLCSDGLDKMLSDRRIQKIIRKHKADPLEQMAKCLIDEALEEGGEDNVTVIVIRVEAPLPRGPTMDIPPETLALEQLVVGDPPPPAGRAPHDEHDETGETANTAGGRTASTMADGVLPSGDRLVGSTPTTPDSVRGGARTPITPAQSASEFKRIGGPAPSDSMTWFWLLFALVILAGVGTFLLLKTRLWAPEIGVIAVAPAGPTNAAPPAAVEGGVGEHPATSPDSQGGAQE